MITSLDRLAEGENATVAALKLDGSIRRRLLDLGMIEGTGIRCERYSPAGDRCSTGFAVQELPCGGRMPAKLPWR